MIKNKSELLQQLQRKAEKFSIWEAGTMKNEINDYQNSCYYFSVNQLIN